MKTHARTSAVLSGRVVRRGGNSIVIHRRSVVVTSLLVLVAAALAVFALTLGTLPIGLGAVVDSLFGTGPDPRTDRVVEEIRLPRVVTAVFAGAALGMSGAVFQSISRNALGSPDVIGFTTGAATGAIVQIVLRQAEPAEVALGAVLGGVLTAAVVYLLSLDGRVSGGYRLVLVGIGVGAILSAVNELLLVVGDLDNAIAANLWLAGSLEARTWEHAVPVALGAVLLAPLLLFLARRATLVEMGDDLSRQLGVRAEPVRVAMIFVGVVLAALATGAAGPIAFIALAAPQLVTRLTRSPALPVVSAAAMGAVLLVLADVVTQLLPWQVTVPIGRVTGLIGGVYLIWILTRSKQV